MREHLLATLDLKKCTIASTIALDTTRPDAIIDSIIQELTFNSTDGLRLEFCNLVSTAGWSDDRRRVAEFGKSCLSVPPMFRDPANLDYRLKPGSPCIGKASDGGDLGCRYTPEMIELCKQALELRRKGILKF